MCLSDGDPSSALSVPLVVSEEVVSGAPSQDDLLLGCLSCATVCEIPFLSAASGFFLLLGWETILRGTG